MEEAVLAPLRLLQGLPWWGWLAILLLPVLLVHKFLGCWIFFPHTPR
jgi:hypothetical protein